jgi:hypothetical protein
MESSVSPSPRAAFPQLVKYVQLPIFEALTGYTRKSIRRKIEEGVWLEGQEYRRAPDGRILVDLDGYQKWVENPKRAG